MSGSHSSVDSDELEAQSLKIKLLQIEVERKQQELDTLRLQNRVLELKDSDTTVLIRTSEDQFAKPNHPAAAPLLGTIPESPEKPGAKLAHIGLNYRLSPKDRATLKAKFPGIIWNEAYYGNHDHPMAHAETLVGSRQLQKKIQPGSKCLDIYGNPAANASFNHGQRGIFKKRIETLVNEFTEKDALRKATKWGEPYEADGATPRWIEGTLTQAIDSGFTAEFDQFISVHTLYYLSDLEIARLLNTRPRSVLSCLVHRHGDGSPEKPRSGLLFDGEMDFWTDGITVTQTNCETNESYTHASIEWLWSNKCKVKRVIHEKDDGSFEKLAFTWGFEKFTDETWIIQLTACSAVDDEGVVNRVAQYDVKGKGNSVLAWRQAFNASNQWSIDRPVKRHVAPEVNMDMKAGEVERIGSLLVVALETGSRPVVIKNEGFYEHLKHQIAGKPRTADNLAALYALARRDTTASTYPGSTKFEVTADEVTDHVCAAFIAGVDRENLNLASIALRSQALKQQQAMSKHAPNSLTANTGTALRQGLRFGTGALRLAGKDKLAGRLEALIE